MSARLSVITAVLVITGSLAGGSIWLHEAELFWWQHATKTEVRALKQQFAGLDLRQLTWAEQSLEQRLWQARKACKAGDSDACRAAASIERQLADVREMLRKRRGF